MTELMKPTEHNGRGRVYTDEFKSEIVKLVNGGNSYYDVAKQFLIPSNTVYTWIQQSKGSASTELLPRSTPAQLRRFSAGKVSNPVKTAEMQSANEQWKQSLEIAIQECTDALRKGTPIDWSKYRYITNNPVTIFKPAKNRLKVEQDTVVLLGPSIKLGKGSIYQYLMLLCLLLGVLGGKPVVAFRDTESKRPHSQNAK